MKPAITILVLGTRALVIGVPVSNVAGTETEQRHGVLLKGSEVIHDFSRTDTMVFDKTGTLTVGNPSVSETKYYTDKADEVLGYLQSINVAWITISKSSFARNWCKRHFRQLKIQSC